ncbi:MAG: hypothetical protein AAF495_04190 [Pseudomonadota bacterium]
MKKLAACTWLCAIAVAAFALFQIKHEVKRLEEALTREHRAVVANQEAIHVLKAEWSYLNRPGRIAELAERHLALQPITVEQIVRFDALPLRVAPVPESEGDNAPLDPELEAILASMRKRQ